MPEIEPRPTASSSRWARRARSLSTTAARCATHARRRPTRRTRCTGAPGRLIRTATALRTLMGGASPGSAGGGARRRSHGDHYVITAWLMCGFIMIIYRCRDFARRRTSSQRRQPRAPRLNARTAALPPHRARWLWAAPSLRAAMMGFVTARSTGWCCTLRRQQQQLAQQQHKNNKPAAPHKRGTAGGLTHREHLATWRIGPPPLPR